jgi:hypothetical protein
MVRVQRQISKMPILLQRSAAIDLAAWPRVWESERARASSPTVRAKNFQNYVSASATAVTAAEPFPCVMMRSSDDRLGRAVRDRNDHQKRLTSVAYRRHALGLGALITVKTIWIAR